MEQKKVSFFSKLYIWLVGLILLASGLFYTFYGAQLITKSAIIISSWYFLLMGIALILTAICLFAFRCLGLVIYFIAFIATLAWAYWEVGTDFWSLVPRISFFIGFAALLAFAYPSIMKYRQSTKSHIGGYLLGILLFACIGGILWGASKPHYGMVATTKPIIKAIPKADAPLDWQQYGNSSKGTRFSGADQVTPENINNLKQAWVFNTGDTPANSGSGAEDQNTPLFIEDMLYICTPHNKVIALQPETGKKLWEYDPKITIANWQRCRGLAFYAGTDDIDAKTMINELNLDQVKALAPPDEYEEVHTEAKADNCINRIFMNTTDERLVALDPKTGNLCEDFGNKGTVDLTKHMGDIPRSYHGPTAPPTVAGDVVVVGARVADNDSATGPSGVVRAYNVYDGTLVWAWDPSNPAITGIPPEGQRATRSSVNVWATMAYDPELDLIYVPTGNATPDSWGGKRTQYDDEFGSSIIALEAKTGKIRWKFQTVHHDLWGYDLPSQPLLYDIPDGKGGVHHALIQTAKSGQIFMLDRMTGKPLAEVIEKEVAQGNVAGERYAKTQPFSVGMPSIGNQTLKESDMWGATPFDMLWCRNEFARMNYRGVFTPLGMDKTLQWPGSLGGMNWSSVSVDPATDYMYVNDMRIGLENEMIPRKDISPNARGLVHQAGTPFGAMQERFMSPIGVPCQAPPYGTMTAIDLKTKKIVWQVPVGTLMDTAIFGIPMHAPFPVGMPTLGGSMATKSGLLFFAGTQDFYLRAFDSYTGKVIWKERLPVGSQGTPITFISPKDGAQYIVLTVGGARQSPKRGDYVMAWKLAN